MVDDRQPQQQRQQEEEEEEDFSFPLIGGNSPCSIESPPWHYSPSTPARLEGGQDEDTVSRVKEEEAREKGVVVVVVLDTSIPVGSKEEKMDMLWEDFNEELWGSSTTAEKRNSKSGSVKVTALSKGSNKGGGGGGGGGGLGALAFVKSLRQKLFLLRGVVTPATPRRRLSQR